MSPNLKPSPNQNSSSSYRSSYQSHNQLKPTLPNKKLTTGEMEEMRQKGLCFGCGAKWSKEHRCRRSQLYQMLLEDLQDEGDNEEFEDCMDTSNELLVVSNGEEQADLSIHAM